MLRIFGVETQILKFKMSGSLFKIIFLDMD